MKRLLFMLSGMTISFHLSFHRVRADAIYDPSLVPDTADFFENILPWMFLILLLGFFGLIRLIAQGLMLNKTAGRGWRIFIPYYGRFLEYKYYWKTVFFWIETGLACYMILAMTAISLIEHDTIISILALFFILAGISLEIISVRLRMKAAETFGHSSMIGLLELIGLGIIPDCICGFSSKPAKTTVKEGKDDDELAAVDAAEQAENTHSSQLLSEHLDRWE